MSQPIVAVPSFICADAFNKFLPFCTGFAAGCMIWMVIAEVLPDAFKVLSAFRSSISCFSPINLECRLRKLRGSKFSALKMIYI